MISLLLPCSKTIFSIYSKSRPNAFQFCPAVFLFGSSVLIFLVLVSSLTLIFQFQRTKLWCHIFHSKVWNLWTRSYATMLQSKLTLLVEFLYGTIQFLRILLKEIWKCAETFALPASYCVMGERVKIEILIFQSTLLSIVRTEIPWNCVS